MVVSVHEKMTAIADKIRALLGVTGAMGLDAMATNLETERTNIVSAFTAIGGKGGTVPTSQVSGNLASAIASIPAGVTVQRKTGRFTTNTSGSATINCGFQPDLVVYYTGDSYSNSMPMWVAFAFAESGVSRIVLLHAPSSKNYDDHIYAESDCSRTTTGFSVKIRNLDFDLTFSNARSASYNYIAIKYTA